MVEQGQPQGFPPQGPGLGTMFEKMTGMPSPDKIMAELQRLNGNIERLAPDIHKIATSIDGLYASDIRSLTQVLQAAKLGEAAKALGEASKALEKWYKRLCER